MITQLDIDESGLRAQAKAGEWEKKFQLRFHEPEIMAALTMQLLKATPEQREEFRAQRPEVYARVSRYVKRLQAMTGTGPVNPATV